MSKQVKCPLCNGEKGSICHHNTGLDSSRHYWGWADCLTCKGTGTVDIQTLSNIEIGKKLRLARLYAGLSLMDAANKYGVSPATISGIENRGRHHSEAPGYIKMLNEAQEQQFEECQPVSLGAAFDLRRIAQEAGDEHR